MKTWITLFLSLHSLCSFSLPESPHVTVREGKVAEGVIWSPTEDLKIVRAEIREQLKFIVGTLNAFGGGAAIDYGMDINLISIEESGNLFKVHYSARLLIAWNKKYTLPETYRVVVPARADVPGLQTFQKTYGTACSNEKNSWATFFYYYRPNRCDIGKVANPSHAVALILEFGESVDSLEKKPEYDRVWKDRALNAIAIFGNTESRDAAEFYGYLRQWYGKPETDQTQNFSGFSLRSLVFETSAGPLNASVFNITQGNIASMGESFKNKFNALSPKADFIAYNGHSGLGANIRAVIGMGFFVSEQYKLYFFNGCDSFSYVNSNLVETHSLLNPNESPTKYVDMITTVMPSLFSQMAHGTATILSALVRKTQSYSGILSQIPNGVPVVLGEEDNSR